MIEKICDFTWRPDGNKRQTDSYHWDGRNVLLSRNGGTPQLLWDGNHEMLGEKVLAQLAKSVAVKGYENLASHTQKLYDFLKFKLKD